MLFFGTEEVNQIQKNSRAFIGNISLSNQARLSQFQYPSTTQGLNLFHKLNFYVAHILQFFTVYYYFKN